jgi:hypothetical protein
VDVNQSDFEKKEITGKVKQVGSKTLGELVHYGQAVQLKVIT